MICLLELLGLMDIMQICKDARIFFQVTFFSCEYRVFAPCINNASVNDANSPIPMYNIGCTFVY